MGLVTRPTEHHLEVEPYSYSSLPDPKAQIRLLKITAASEISWEDYERDGKIQHSHIECSLSIHDLASCPEYVAISYTWGPEELAAVVIDGRSLSVRRNCSEVLHLANHHFRDSLIWIDAICIDQNNNEEKSSQVRLMSNIYASAREVAACLGPPGADADFILGTTAGLPRKETRSLQDSESTLLKTFGDRTYWSRLWVVQECLSAEYLRFICGRHMVYSTDLEWLCYKIDIANVVSLNMLTMLETCLWQDDSEGDWGLSDMLCRFSDRHCSDPRDRIYGLMSVVDGAEVAEIEVDYNISLPLLARSVMLALPDWDPSMTSWRVRKHSSQAIRVMLSAMHLLPQSAVPEKVAFDLCRTAEDVTRLRKKYEPDPRPWWDIPSVNDLATSRLEELSA